MNRVILQVLAVCALAAAAAVPAAAESMRIEAVLAPEEQMRLDFEDGNKHFVLLVRREGKAEGSGPLAGARPTAGRAFDRGQEGRPAQPRDAGGRS